jgi:chaperonin GroES
MDLQPLGDRVIVELLDEEQTLASGIVLPDTAKEKPQRGKVLAVGAGEKNDNGEYVPVDVVVGDVVVFSKYGGTEIKVGADEYLILRESDILAKVVGAAKAPAKKK